MQTGLARIVALCLAGLLAAFAAAQIAHLTGDRSRGLPPELRAEVVRRLVAIRAPEGWIAMVRDGARLDETAQRRSFGEPLPPGLRLIGEQ